MELILLGKQWQLVWNSHLQSYPTWEVTELGCWYSTCHQGCSCRAGFNSIMLFWAKQASKALEKAFRQKDAGTGSGKAAGTFPSGKEYGQDIGDVSHRVRWKTLLVYPALKSGKSQTNLLEVVTIARGKTKWGTKATAWKERFKEDDKNVLK